MSHTGDVNVILKDSFAMEEFVFHMIFLSQEQKILSVKDVLAFPAAISMAKSQQSLVLDFTLRFHKVSCTVLTADLKKLCSYTSFASSGVWMMKE